MEDCFITMVENGHGLEMLVQRNAEGHVDRFDIWCHTCDPMGLDNIMVSTVDYSREAWMAAMSEATRLGKEHAATPR